MTLRNLAKLSLATRAKVRARQNNALAQKNFGRKRAGMAINELPIGIATSPSSQSEKQREEFSEKRTLLVEANKIHVPKL